MKKLIGVLLLGVPLLMLLVPTIYLMGWVGVGLILLSIALAVSIIAGVEILVKEKTTNK